MSRRIAPQRKPTPKWVWIALIVAPIVLIGLVVNLQIQKNAAPPAAVVTADPNARIKELQKQVDFIRKDYKAWRELMQAEDPSAKQKQEALIARLDGWIDEWDGIFESKRDAEGILPPELQGYQPTRAKINEVREDVLKSSGF
jgi:hypothetical protein